MKTRLNLIIKNTFIILTCALFLTGCASMSYIGSDYNVQNVKSVQTNEGLYFSTYKKTSTTENIDMSVGLTRTSVPEVLAVYIAIKNNNETPYITYQKDYVFSANSKRMSLVSSSEYINAYQSQETGTYASMQALAPTISNIATIANNFQPTGQEQTVYQQNTRNNLSGQVGNVAEGIMKYSLSSAGVIDAGSQKYFYMFIQSDEGENVTLQYKDLFYTFGKKTES